MRAELEKAYILHTRPYGDTSVIASCFTERYGRIPLIAKGVRNKKTKQRQYLQPFTPLILSWQGKSTLKTLTHMETQGVPQHLFDRRLYSGFYLNELLMRLLPEHDDHQALFQAYALAIEELHGEVDLETILRRFEFQLLEELGYGLNFFQDVDGAAIHEEAHYRYQMEQGFVAVTQASVRDCFRGEELLALARQDLSSPVTRQAAKQLSRLVMRPLLGNRPLESRKLFETMVPQGVKS